MSKQGPSGDIFGPNYGVANQFVDRVDDVKTFAEKFRDNLQVSRLEQHNCIFTRPLAYLNTGQLSTLCCGSHYYVDLQNFNLIVQNLIASNFK